MGQIIQEHIYDDKGKLKETLEYVQGPFLGKGGFARVY